MTNNPQGKLNKSDLKRKYTEFLAGGSLGNLKDYEPIISRGLGSKVWDLKGNKYIDYLLGSGPMLIGHSNSNVISAIKKQLDLGFTFFAGNEQVILLAEEIVNAVKCAESVRFCSTGTEATLYAMRIARAFKNKDKILKFEGGFHGMNDYALMSMNPLDPKPFPLASSDSAGIPKSIESEILIAPFNNLSVTSDIVEKHKDELAGVIVEPFQRSIPPLPGFLEGLRKITKSYDIPLIFDETVTGFRFAYGGAQEYYDVTPDLCTVGKAVSGGFPLTAVCGRLDMMSHFDYIESPGNRFVPQIGTLNGNPIAAVAGLATLNELKKPGVYNRIFETGNKIMKSLVELFEAAKIPAKVTGVGALFDIYFTDEEIIDYGSTLTANKSKMVDFNKKLLQNGVLKGNSKFYISSAHENDDIRDTIKALEETIESIKSN